MASGYTSTLFEYIPACVYSIGGISDEKCHYLGCKCVSCSDVKCSCLYNSHSVYEEGRLKIDNINCEREINSPIFECNSNCVCDINCPNRLTQRNVLKSLQVFSTDCKGLGLRSDTHIIGGQFVIEFIGEVIKVKEAKIRLEGLKDNPCYIMVLKEHAGDEKTFITCIDATLKGNESHYINHSCDPNLILFPVRVNSPLPHLCLFAKKDICVGEELTYDYAGGCDVMGNKAVGVCLCKSANCRGYLPCQDV